MAEFEIRGAHMGLIALAAGGTGGHLFPAQALAEELVRRGYITILLSDARAKSYGGDFPAIDIAEIPSSTLSIRKPWKLPFQAFRLWRGMKKSRILLGRNRPKAIIGFGGYPSFPPLLTAVKLGIPSAIHEQNAVMGRANRAMAKKVDVIASSFPEIAHLPEKLKDKVVFTGNPVRAVVIEAAKTPYAPPDGKGTFELLIFGGSQGAHYFAELAPKMLAEMPEAVRKRLHVTQQARPEDIDALRHDFNRLGIDATVESFFGDMPKRMAGAHLVMARSGASSVAELAVIGRPAILVPLPHALDNDQLMNARAFARAGAGWVYKQDMIQPEQMAAFITRLRYAPDDLMAAHKAARAFARPDAAARLADVVEKLAGADEKPAGAASGAATPEAASGGTNSGETS